MTAARTRLARLAAMTAMALLLAGGTARAQYIPGAGLARPPPPPPIFESVPPRPAPGLVWTPGRWRWDGANWRWHSGRFHSRFRFRDMYIPGHWQRDQGAGFRWVPGGLR